MELSLSTPEGATLTPTPVEPDTASFAALQDRMRSEASGETPPEAPAAPPRRTEAAPAAPKRGRPRKDTSAKPRTTTTSAKAAPAANVDYTEAARGMVSGVWVVAASLPPTQPYAALLNAQAEPLATALAEGARHSEGIRQWLTGSAEHAWKIQLASVAASLGMGALQLARDPELREQARAATRAQLAALTPPVEGSGQPDAEAAPAAS